MGRWMSKIKNKEYGQAMAEFALTLPIFLLLVFGVIELSRFFLVYSSVFTASREASRFGSSVGDITDQNYLNCAAVAERAVFSGSFGGVQLNDITVSYESTPGTIVASCPDVNSGSVPIIEGCTIGNCDYTPELGHRILVDIETDFDSLLGVVPDLAVRATNGRTIMKEIQVLATTKPDSICENDLELNTVSLVQENSNKKVLFININNISTFGNYKLSSVDVNIGDDGSEQLYLISIYWGGTQIWQRDIDLPEETEFSIPGDDFEDQFTRNLPAGSSKKIEFEFSKNVPDYYPLTFSLYFEDVVNGDENFCGFSGIDY